MDRQTRAQIAADTVAILEAGRYALPDGTSVDLRAAIEHCVAGTVHYLPAELDVIVQQVTAASSPGYATDIRVVDETTLAGARHLTDAPDRVRVGVLNFASAKRPGGGFLNGAGAQEESLARASALYASLQSCPFYYHHHRRLKQSTYTDAMIYSPDCPVFRDDNGLLLDLPYPVDFITSAAPNAGALRKRGSHVARIPAILGRRATKVLALAATRGCDALVLGAWGCGVFRNDPRMVASTFGALLGEGGLFAGRFKSVRFSVVDPTADQANLQAFQEVFP